LRLLPAFLLVCSLVSAQQKSYFIEDILLAAAGQKDYVVENATIEQRTWSVRKGNAYGQLQIGRMFFINCRFKGDVEMDSVTMQLLELKDCTIDAVTLYDVNIDTLWVQGGTAREISLKSFSFANPTFATSQVQRVLMYELDIDYFQSISTSIWELHIELPEQNGFVTVDHSKIEYAFLHNTRALKVSDSELGLAHLQLAMDEIDIERTRITKELLLNWVTLSGSFRVAESQFDGFLTISKLAVPAENIELPFSQVANGKLRAAMGYTRFKPDLNYSFEQMDYITKDSLTVNVLDSTYRAGSRDSSFLIAPLFDKLVYNYQRLYNSYKARGDVESANACYVEMKELDRSRLRYRYQKDPSFKSFFRLQLSTLLKLYTEYGTDPAKAIVASMYVVLIFAFFYFFFPSDWDVTSKSRLVNNYREFIEKNEKGYFRPFLRLTSGFTLSFVNALTLSLNAFTTLGFGNIPTHGLARYVCVVQGFIGWFLLSIFTVALISQALF
jgi:hypothetical protein